MQNVKWWSLLIAFLILNSTFLIASPALAQVSFCTAGTTPCPQGCTLGVSCTSCWSATDCRAVTGQTAAPCGSCQCPSGQIVCGGACRTPATNPTCATLNRSVNTCTGACGACASGFVEDSASPGGACMLPPTPAYINFNNPGELRISNSLRIVGTAGGVGDLYLNSGKAIRIDGGGTTTLNIGNWGVGGTNVNVNVLGTVTATQFCIGASCVTAWPPAGGGGGGGLGGSGAANQVAYFTGATALASEALLFWDAATNRLGVGTATPASTLTVRRADAGVALAVRSTADDADTFAITDAGVVTAGNVPWARLMGFPAACGGGEFVRVVGTTLTCAAPPAAAGLTGGVANKLAFWTSATALGQNVNLHWDNATGRLGIGTVVPTQALEVRDDGEDNPAVDGEQGVARLRITDVTDAARQNPALQLKYGTGVDDHWEMYYDRATTSLRFWRGDNRLTLTSTGDLRASGCLGATFVGTTVETYDGILVNAGGLDRGNGYRDADGLCASVLGLEGSHVCNTPEILESVRCAAAAGPVLTATGTAWINNGPPGHTSLSNDCDGRTSNAGTTLGAFWRFEAAGGRGNTTTCNLRLRLACCR